jgi:hypothetical protein
MMARIARKTGLARISHNAERLARVAVVGAARSW